MPNVYDNKHKECIEILKKAEGFSITVDETQDKNVEQFLIL